MRESSLRSEKDFDEVPVTVRVKLIGYTRVEQYQNRGTLSGCTLELSQ